MSQHELDLTTISASSAVFSLRNEFEINAPASYVFSLFSDISTWPSWNTLNPNPQVVTHGLDNQNQGSIIAVNNAQLITGPNGPQLQATPTTLREGTIFNIPNSVPKSGFSSFATFLCYHVDAEERSAAWIYYSEMNPTPKALLEVERATRVVDLGGGRCKFESLERQTGLKAAYVKVRYAKSLQKAFDAQAQPLKKYTEAKYNETK
ncbi:hypothetical protein CC79DRAFT_908210 [Sarocladium strictum]